MNGKIEFPTPDSSHQVWAQAAIHGGQQILDWIRSEATPHAILQLREPTLVDLTQHLRLRLLGNEIEFLAEDLQPGPSPNRDARVAPSSPAGGDGAAASCHLERER